MRSSLYRYLVAVARWVGDFQLTSDPVEHNRHFRGSAHRAKAARRLRANTKRHGNAHLSRSARALLGG